MPVTSEEHFVTGVYSAVDKAAAGGLDFLRSEGGIVATCKVGCCHCCQFHILTSSAEAHALGQYVKRELSEQQIDALRQRTRQWHDWDSSRPGRYPSESRHAQTDLSRYDHSCPLLVDGTCSAYPVRPVVCRTHFVRSPQRSCSEANNPESTEDAPVVLTSVVAAARPFSLEIRAHIENEGRDFSRSFMLLPQWLAIEMDWDFAIAH
ncbi:MAG: hypothetical protein ABIL58_18120 [Pseudomonadota bacterium]